MKSNQLCRDFQTAFAGADVRGVLGGLIGCAIYLYFRVRLAIELNQMQSKPDETKSNVVFGLQFELSAIKVDLIGESSLRV